MVTLPGPLCPTPFWMSDYSEAELRTLARMLPTEPDGTYDERMVRAVFVAQCIYGRHRAEAHSPKGGELLVLQAEGGYYATRRPSYAHRNATGKGTTRNPPYASDPVLHKETATISTARFHPDDLGKTVAYATGGGTVYGIVSGPSQIEIERPYPGSPHPMNRHQRRAMARKKRT